MSSGLYTTFQGDFRGKARRELEGIETPRSPRSQRDWGLITKGKRIREHEGYIRVRGWVVSQQVEWTLGVLRGLSVWRWEF